MKKTTSFLVGVIILVLAGIFLFQCEGVSCLKKDAQQAPAGAELKVYDSEKFGVQFSYPDKYFLETKELGDGHRGHFAIILTEDTEENRLVREGLSPGREGPTAIVFDLFQSPETDDVLSWVMGNGNSNFKLSDGTYKETTLSGKPAISYTSDGLYLADNIVVAHQDYMALISVTYITREDEMRADFSDLLKTVKFY